MDAKGFDVVNPPELAEPRGWSHGIAAPAGGRMLFVAGQTAGGADGEARGSFAEQFALALDRALAVVRAAGGEPPHVGRMTIYVTDMAAYRAARAELGAAWRARMGRHYPAMALVEVRGLVEPGALVEIEATAVLPPEIQEPDHDSSRREATLNPDSFQYELDEATAVATLTLNRPERGNALTFEVYDELRRAFRALAGERQVRAVVLTGAGRAFCTGGDVRDIIGPLLDMDSEQLLEFTTMTCDLVAAIRECPQPVVGALNGVTAGAGAVIATACDARIAAESARIAYLFTRVGLSGADMGIAWLLPRIVGLGRASQLLMTGEFIDAREAERIGLFSRVVPDDEALPAARRLAARLAAGPSAGLAATKRALEREAHMTLPDALAEEARVQAACMEDPNFPEGYRAFVEKRAPVFS